jgi:DNA-binding MarR family transcriptional regulator
MEESSRSTQEDGNSLSDKELKLLEVLWRKGPAIPIELAVRTLSFPEEIAEPLERLEEKGLVEVDSFDAGAIAQKLVSLSRKGVQVLENRRG